MLPSPTAESSAIGDLSERDAHERIPCAGLAIAPGFIDVHSHSDELWLVDPRCEGRFVQGVTTEIGGNCGTSIAPLSGCRAYEKRRDAADYRLEVQWTSFDAFFTLVEQERVTPTSRRWWIGNDAGCVWQAPMRGGSSARDRGAEPFDSQRGRTGALGASSA